jgi:hypothetical protein
VVPRDEAFRLLQALVQEIHAVGGGEWQCATVEESEAFINRDKCVDRAIFVESRPAFERKICSSVGTKNKSVVHTS